jgi:hypothetical protein
MAKKYTSHSFIHVIINNNKENQNFTEAKIITNTKRDGVERAPIIKSVYLTNLKENKIKMAVKLWTSPKFEPHSLSSISKLVTPNHHRT